MVSRVLQEIALFLELKGESSFKSRAYYNAARTLEQMGAAELHRLVQEDRLKDIQGIGTALNDKIKELVLTGRLSYYDELKDSIPEGLLEMLKVPGLGPKKIKALHETLGITTLGELEYACKENRLVSLKGFGPKTQENVIKGIEFVRRSQGLFFYSEASRVAAGLLESLQDFPAMEEISLAGSIRRCKEIVKDIDLVCSTGDPIGLSGFFAGLSAVEEVIARGETKVSVRLQEGINADLRIVRPGEFPFALHHFTGSKEHNTAMRHRAKKMGLKMNEYGLFPVEDEGAEPGDRNRTRSLQGAGSGVEKARADASQVRSEGDLFLALGLAYIPPELRENHGEIEAAEKGALPQLVEQEDIRGIFHIHTVYSDGVNTLEEVVRSCRDKGYAYVGISDHSQSAFYAGGLKENDLKRQLEEIERLREQYPEIAIFKGVESDIRGDGSLDYPDAILEQLDFVIASVHSGLNMAREKMTGRLLQALTHPRVTMLGHPTGRILLGREEYALDLEKVLEKAQEKGVILELNASPARLDLDWRHLKKAKEMGLLVSINPDAHGLGELADTDLGVAMARKGWLEKKDVFNTRSRQEVVKYLRDR